jgi:uncharacterized OB-fold protein
VLQAEDDAAAPRRPDPIATTDSQFFWEAASEGRLVAQRCSGCQRLRHPPRPMCPHCHSLAVEVVTLSGRGTLYSYAILHYPQHPAFDYPVFAALVDLEEGVRIVSNLTHVGPEDIRIGMPLQVHFAPTAPGGQVPVFQPAPTGRA